MMKKSILALAALAAIVTASSSAQGQDLDGAYLGLNAGYGWGVSEVLVNGNAVTPSDLEAKSYQFGIVGGYNVHQGGVLYGVEADIGMLDHEASYQTNPGGAGNQTATSDLLYLASARARLGVDLGGFVPFVAAGLAAGENVTTLSGGGVSISDRGLQWGYNVGAGVEVGVSEQISMKLEYLYTDIGNPNSVTVSGPGGSSSLGAGHHIHAFRLGANFHF